MLSLSSSILVSLLVSIAAGVAVPLPLADKAAPVNYELIPGPGLPSLASLGLTTADLLSQNFKPVTESVPPSHPSALFKRQAAKCTYNSQYQTNRGNAIVCRNYLIQIGGDDCSTGESYTVLCTYANAEIVAQNYYNYAGGIYSSCADAAVAAGWVIDNCSTCTDDNCWVEGSYPSSINNNWVAYVDLNQGFQGREDAAAKAAKESGMQ